MADQKRWFKVWVSILDDPHFQELSLEDIGRWTLLGALTAFVGTKGRLRTPAGARRLREALRMNGADPLKEVIERLPSVSFEEGKKDNPERCVTWTHWQRYQRDSTVAERVKRLRSKRRGEEKRSRGEVEEKRKPPPSIPPPVQFHVPARIEEALGRAPTLHAVAKLHTPAFWQAQVRANSGVNFADEILKAEAWLTSNPGRAPRKDLARFLHNWLARADRPPDTEE